MWLTPIFVLTVLTLSITCHDCPENWFDCGNDRCIARFWRCDGEDDCGNMKDEENCDNHKSEVICASSQFRCTDHRCIPMKWACDGEKDCIDGSDELKCDNSTSNCDGFQCEDHHCIPERWHCDGLPDCPDGSDEILCRKASGNVCSEREFICSSGSCLEAKKVCDGKKDCSDGSDEGNHCGDACKNTSCAHICKATPSGAQCSCHNGYKIGKDAKSCSDIDECLEDGFCSHKCTNSIGGYKCTCNEGYELKNRTCFAIGGEPLLIFATLKEIRGLKLRSGMYFPIHDGISRSTAVDADPTNSRIYWTDVSQQGSAVYSSNMDGTGFQTVVNNGLLTAEDVCVDYIARNLYITDSGLKQVMVCKIDGSICSPLHTKDVDKPRALALDPGEGLMYWSDWGVIPGIYRSGMDGTRRTTLVSKDLKWPNGITIDHTTNRLYWCDGQMYRIEYITLDGKTRKIVLQDTVFHPYSLTIFEDLLYWTDWKTFSLDSCNKFTGHKQHLVVRENGKHIMGVHIYHPVLSKEVENPCFMSLCSHLCVMAPMGRHRCLCPPGLSLATDQITCLMDNKSPQLFVSEGSSVFSMQPEAVGNGVTTRLPIHQLELVGDLDYDYGTKTLFISDVRKRAIFAVNMASFNKRILVQHHIQSVEGLAYDYLSSNLYWTDVDKGTVEVLSQNTSHRTVLLSNLSRPLAIALAPEKGFMFLSVIGEPNPHVAKYDMDGKNRRELIKLSGLPMSLALHQKTNRLYYADPVNSVIASINYLNLKEQKQIHKRNVVDVTSIAVSDAFIYWTDSKTHSLHLIQHNSTRSIVHSLPLLGNFTGGTTVRKVNYINVRIGGSGSCSHNNGGCSHICLLTPTGRTCACPVGLQMSKNSVTCSEHKNCTSREFKCVKTSLCLPEEFRCDGSKDCADGSDEENCETILHCPPGDFQCNNGRCILAAYKCDFKDDCGDGSDEVGCPRPHNCPRDRFPCGNGQCVPNLWRCDGVNDCNNGKDEELCDQTKCDKDKMRCDHGQCIAISWVCDGAEDCLDGTDERNCSTQVPSCNSNQFQCANGACIDKVMACDHRFDCTDHTDEKDCVYNTTCKPGMFRCDDGLCIYIHEVCDGYGDCSNKEEEVNCTKTECSATEFYCSSTKRCIPREWLCDGDNDCGDGADEKLNSCNYKPTTPSPRPFKVAGCEQFTCNSGSCLSWTKVCDGVPDCLDLSDEGSLCVTSCGKTNGGCSHLCSPSPQGSRCSCLAGYKLLGDGKTCEDENECLTPGLCSQFCNNTKGGFKCSCAEGYFLAHDHSKCKADGGSASLVYLLPDQIRAFELGSHSQRVYVQGELTDRRGLDYDAAEGVFFWTEWKEGTINSYNLGSNRNDIIVHDLQRPYYVKWDWIARNLYYTNGEGSILACKRNGEFCTTIIESAANHINSFELAPENGLMFWSVWSDVRKAGSGVIERAQMDGSGRIAIISEKIYWPTSVTVDNVLKTIYWTDVKLNVIETADFHGLDRRVVIQDDLQYPFSMTLFEDYVYWADWGTDSIFRCDKFSRGDCLQLHKGDVKSEAIVVVHKVLQPKGVNRCEKSGCPQMCLQKTNGFTCRCDRRFGEINSTCVKRVTTRRPPVTYHPDAETCSDDYCLNGAHCFINGMHKYCRCIRPYSGSRCEIAMQAVTKPHDYSWIVAVFLGLFAVGVILLVILLCRRNKDKLSKLGENVAVSFRNPRFGMRKTGRLVMDTDDDDGGIGAADDLMLGKQGAYTPAAFGNPLFGKKPYLDPEPPQGDFKRWPSYDSEDSAFVSEYQVQDGSNLNIDQASMTSSKTGDKIVQFFKRL